MRTFREVIDAHAAIRPAAPCIVAPEPATVLTYAELRRSGAALGSYLSHAGIAPGAVVSFMLPNGIAAASVFLGAMYAGYVVSPVNLLGGDAQLEFTLAHSRTRLVFTAPEHVARLRALLQRAQSAAVVCPTDPDRLELAGHPDAALTAVAPETPAMLMYTSGTTGTPRGVLLSHWNMLYAAGAVVAAQELTESDRVLSALPLYHINGQCIATVSPVLSGGSVVMPHRFSASQWWPLIERYRPTWLNVVPTIIAYLLNGPDVTAAQASACRAIRFGRSASAPLPIEQHRAFETRFGISVIEAMGLTETASVAFANPLDASRRKYGSVGLPLGIEARIVAADGTGLGAGEQGEIQVRGANVIAEYFRAPELTAEARSAEGWLATGDLGYRDGDGYYFVAGRRKELIIKGGENIAPREIDEALLRHPAVLEAAAVGIPDPNYGQDILACVVLKPGARCDEAELRAHCLAQLGRYKAPRWLRLVAALPKGPSGKVQRLRLLDLQ
ncbi:MAG TPA: AMP-binding protein [Casimicrobiaceae bacterium]|jgi:long-chain acyl-CoA synthetase|nr:AMP-binding protein [Casimicrobiaceae bacterium]